MLHNANMSILCRGWGWMGLCMGQSTNYSRVGHGTGRVEDTQRPSHEFQSGGRERSTLGAQQVSESGGGQTVGRLTPPRPTTTVTNMYQQLLTSRCICFVSSGNQVWTLPGQEVFVGQRPANTEDVT